MSNRHKSNLCTANHYFKLGEFSKAIELYNAWSNENPGLSKMIRANIIIASNKLKAKITTKATPKVTVIIPCHNVSSYLEKCINSVTNQSLKDLQIIIVNDGSTDDTLKIIKEHEAKDQRILTISNSTKSGNSGTPRNQALHYATGDYISFVDADDWIEPNMLQDLYEKAKLTNSDITSSSGFFREVGSGETLHVRMKNYEHEPNQDTRRTELFASPHVTIVWFRIYRRTFVEENGIRFAPTKTSADAPFAILSLIRANRISSVNRSHYHYLFDRPGSTIEKRKGIGSFELINSYRFLLSKLQPDERGAYGDLIINKLLGDYDYNRSLISEDLKGSFDNAVLKFASELCRVPDPSIFSAHKIALLNRGRNMPTLKNAETLTTQNPIVSIIVPANNVEKYISRCMESLEKLTPSAVEIIVVDDGSTDRTLEKLEETKKRNLANLIIVSSSKMSGNPGTPRNVGIELSTGHYISFIDADDWIENREYEKLTKAARTNNFDIISASHFKKHREGEIIKLPTNYKNYDSRCDDRSKAFHNDFFSNIWNRFYKKDFINKHNIRFPRMYLAEDMCFSAKAHTYASSACAVDSCFYNYFYERENSTTTYRKGAAGLNIIRDIPTIVNYLELNTKNNDGLIRNLVEEKILNSLIYTYKKIDPNLRNIFSEQLNINIENFRLFRGISFNLQHHGIESSHAQ